MTPPRKIATKKPTVRKSSLSGLSKYPAKPEQKLTPPEGANPLTDTKSVDPTQHIRLYAAPNVQVAGDILTKVCYEAAARSGWWKGENGLDVREWPEEFFRLWVGTKIGLMHTELSEGLEGFRKGKMDEHIPELTSLEVELADAVIRICDLSGGLGIDLGRAIGMKLHYNSLRADHKPENRMLEGGKKF